MKSITVKRMVVGGLLLTLAAGCTTYYKVTDPTTGKVYYSTEVQERNSGATSLKDAKTGEQITVQNSEVIKINKEQFETATHAPAPAPAPAPTQPPESPPLEGTPTELLAAAATALEEQRFDDAHALASRAWESEHDNAAVRVMALAACEMKDGALARAAFRKLKSPPIRTEVYTLCRARAVDVRANVSGYTPGELLVKARRELDRGEHDRAYELARSSNKLSHSSDALALMATCACHEHDAADARHLVDLLPGARKREVLDACKAAGTDLTAG